MRGRTDNLAWVDEFIANVRPYVRVRAEDNLLIRMPNVAHKLNDQGVRVLGFLLDGGVISELLERVGGAKVTDEPRVNRPADGEDRTRDIALFLWEVRRCLEGTLREDNHSCAVEVGPLPVNFTSLPVLSEVAVTSRCNLSCVFCYAGCSCLGRPGGDKGSQGDRSREDPVSPFSRMPSRGTSHPVSFREAGRRRATGNLLIEEANGGASSGDMSAADIKEVLRRIRHDAGVPSVSFTGGEPTLRDDLCELIACARELDFRVNLITNGTRVNRRYARKLAKAGLHSAQVSLEGTSAATHDAITRVKGSFGRSLAGVGHLKAVGIRVHTNTTLNVRNLGDAPLFPRFIKRQLGLERFSMNMIIPAGTASVTDSLLLRYSEIGPVLEEVIAAAEAADAEFMWYSPTPLCIFNPITHGLGNKGCSACDGLLSVDARGDVLPCSSFDEPVGNLLADDFSAIWESGRARDLRLKSLAHQGCHDCDNFAACHGACPLYWERFGFGELVS